MTEEITNNEDIISSKDIIARIEELQEDADLLDDSELSELADLELFELEILTALDQDGRGRFPDSWEDGVCLIRDSYFTKYAQELAEDIGAISDTNAWPANCIDWNYAAKQLTTDYACLEFGGVEYWAR